MLKWAVNGTRQSYMSNDEHEKLDLTATKPTITKNSTPRTTSQHLRRHLKRKSSSTSDVNAQTAWYDKENRCTSTPLQPSPKRLCNGTALGLTSLRDLSNITPESAQRRHNHLKGKTPETLKKTLTKLPPQYASTLPTFEVEYSPCNIVPGPILALRGVGLPDSYFEKPRYLNTLNKQNSDEDNTLETKIISSSKSLIKIPQQLSNANINDEESLSSSKMGDTTLERMIDAILESTRKDKKAPKHMSPTYTPADDPASDLHEMWNERSYQPQFNRTREKYAMQTSLQQQQQQQHNDAVKLKRQRGVRRKRKLPMDMIMNSAQKLLGKNYNNRAIPLDGLKEKEKEEEEANVDNIVRNISPDSGHNSSSEYEEEEKTKERTDIIDNNDDALNTTTHFNNIDNKSLDATKRRLSFSAGNFDEVS